MKSGGYFRFNCADGRIFKLCNDSKGGRGATIIGEASGRMDARIEVCRQTVLEDRVEPITTVKLPGSVNGGTQSFIVVIGRGYVSRVYIGHGSDSSNPMGTPNSNKAFRVC
jgi:hypothetical protein